MDLPNIYHKYSPRIDSRRASAILRWRASKFEVWGLGFRVWSLEFGVWGLRSACPVESPGFRSSVANFGEGKGLVAPLW